MKLAISAVLSLLCPALGLAGIAGDWGGVLTYAQGSHHIVLHISGPDDALKATHDSPDQGVFGTPVPSITLTGSTLQWSIPFIDVHYTGDLTANGAIVGTFTQHGTGLPFTLERVAVAPHVTPPLTEPAGTLDNGHYHHNPTGVEFDLPPGWSIGRTLPRDGDPNQLTVLVDPSHKVMFASAYMVKGNTPPANISLVLDSGMRMLIARRAGQTGSGPTHVAANYKIREGSQEKTLIGGHQALRAIGEVEQNGKPFVELLAWIDTEQTRTFFVVKTAAENLTALQGPFEQMLQSTRIP